MRMDNNRLHPLSAHIHYPIYTNADEARKNYYSYLQMPITTLKYADAINNPFAAFTLVSIKQTKQTSLFFIMLFTSLCLEL